MRLARRVMVAGGAISGGGDVLEQRARRVLRDPRIRAHAPKPSSDARSMTCGALPQAAGGALPTVLWQHQDSPPTYAVARPGLLKERPSSADSRPMRRFVQLLGLSKGERHGHGQEEALCSLPWQRQVRVLEPVALERSQQLPTSKRFAQVHVPGLPWSRFGRRGRNCSAMKRRTHGGARKGAGRHQAEDKTDHVVYFRLDSEQHAAAVVLRFDPNDIGALQVG